MTKRCEIHQLVMTDKGCIVCRREREAASGSAASATYEGSGATNESSGLLLKLGVGAALVVVAGLLAWKRPWSPVPVATQPGANGTTHLEAVPIQQPGPATGEPVDYDRKQDERDANWAEEQAKPQPAPTTWNPHQGSDELSTKESLKWKHDSNAPAPRR